jgi:outer membrane protein assembly factor BamA
MSRISRMCTLAFVLAAVATTAPAQAPNAAADSAAERQQARAPATTTSVRVLPVLGSAPETGFVLGATVLRVSSRVNDTITRPSSEQVYASYTAKQQFRAFASTDRWSANNRWGLNGQLEYARFPQPFFGVGIDTPESAEEWYEARSTTGTLTVRRRMLGAVYGQAGYRFSTTSIRDVESGREVERGELLGMRGGLTSQLTSGLAFDSRDNIFAPAVGTFAQVTGAWAAEALGSDYEFGRYIGDARKYVRLGNGVLAAQAYVEASSGRVPFDQLAMLGSGSVMRGYVRGRYRDRSLIAAQAEYRLTLIGRFGMAGFAGAGTVAPTLADVGSSTLLPSFGVGARWLLLPKQRTTVRVDYAMGKGSSGLYIAFNEAF